MDFLGGLAENIIAGIASAPIIALLSFLVYRILREVFRGKFYGALFSALGTNDPKDRERYRLKHYVKHTFVLENSETGDAVFSYKQFLKRAKNTKFVVILGSAGMGKSKLMQKLALQLRTRQRGTGGDSLQDYGILFYRLKGDGSVEHIVSRIAEDVKPSQGSYTLFLDGVDEMSCLHDGNGDELLRDLIRALQGQVAGRCKTVFISLRPEILGKGYSFYKGIHDAEIAVFKLRNFEEGQILAMYRSEARNRTSQKRGGASGKVRRENIKKLKTVVKENPESVFSYPLILTWADEILSNHTAAELRDISWYDALGEVVDKELKREFSLYCSINNLEYSDELRARFLSDGKAFLKELALTMACRDTLQVTKSEALNGEVAKRLEEKYGKTTLIARHLLRYIDWSEKGQGEIYYEFLHNTIYWRILAEALLDRATPQALRAKIILKEAENNFSTPLIRDCRQGLWSIYKEQGFACRGADGYAAAIRAGSIVCKTEEGGVPPEVALSCFYGLKEVNFDGWIRFDFVKIREFVREGKLNLSCINTKNLRFLERFGPQSFRILDCSLSDVTEAAVPDYVEEVHFRKCSSLRSVTFPNDSCLSKIGERAFEGCTSLTDLTIPNKVKSIGGYAFYECTSLAYVKLSDGLSDMGEAAFAKCTSLKKITVPNSVLHIGRYGFAKCTSLAEVELSNQLTDLGESVFQECSSLKRIGGCDGITSLGPFALAECTSLTEIALSKQLHTIEQRAFWKCTSLKSIAIPKSVKKIMSGAFSECTSMEHVEYAGTTEDWSKIEIGENSFLDTKVSEILCKDGTVKIN